MIGIRVWSTRYKGQAFSLFNSYRARVEADGGIVESFSCTIAGLRI